MGRRSVAGGCRSCRSGRVLGRVGRGGTRRRGGPSRRRCPTAGRRRRRRCGGAGGLARPGRQSRRGRGPLRMCRCGRSVSSAGRCHGWVRRDRRCRCSSGVGGLVDRLRVVVGFGRVVLVQLSSVIVLVFVLVFVVFVGVVLPGDVAAVADLAEEEFGAGVGAALLEGAGVAGFGDGGEGVEDLVDGVGVGGGDGGVRKLMPSMSGRMETYRSSRERRSRSLVWSGSTMATNSLSQRPSSSTVLCLATSTTRALSNCLEVSRVSRMRALLIRAARSWSMCPACQASQASGVSSWSRRAMPMVREILCLLVLVARPISRAANSPGV